MATLTSSTRAIEPPREKRGTFSKSFNWTYFLQDNVTGSRALTIWVALLTVITLSVAVAQMGSDTQACRLDYWRLGGCRACFHHWRAIYPAHARFTVAQTEHV